MTCAETTGDVYYIMWTDKGLKSVFNYTAHDKQYIVDILADRIDANLVGNPIRTMIVESVSSGLRCMELWCVQSALTEEEIVAEFNQSPDELKQEIRNMGELIYTTGA
jgi:hypothetical protein